MENNNANNKSQIETKSETTAKAGAISSLSLKDKTTLIVSLIALLISASTFIIGRLDANTKRENEGIESEKKQKSQDYKAFALGQQVVRAFLFWFEVPKGESDPEKLVKAKESGTFEISKLQQLTDLLDLRITDVRAFFTSPNVTNSDGEVDPSQPFKEIRERIRLTSNKRTLAAYEVSYAILLMFVRSKVYADRPEAAQSVLENYSKIAEGINHNLAELGIKKRIPNSHSTLPEIENEMGDLKQYLENLWSY